MFTRISAEDSGVTMRHPLIPAHTRNYLYTSGFACGGVCIGDVDGDGRPDLYFTSGPEPNRLYLQTGKPFVFRNATEEAGLSGRMPDGTDPWAAGATIVDLNGDAHLDIYVCNYDAPNQLFINDGHGRFTEQARQWGLGIVDASLMGAFMDIDGSGELALYLLTNRYERPGGRPEKPPVVTVDGTPRIAPEFEKHYGLRKSGPNNYHVDFVGRPDRLLVVQRDKVGKRTYRDISREAGLLPTGAHGLSATWFDYDGDHRPDLYVCNDFTDADWFYRNEGKGPDGIVRFKNVIAEVVPVTAWSSMGSDAADINNDGLVDLVVGDMASRTHYQAMLNTGNLADRLDTLLHSRPRQTMRNVLFLNSGTGHFLETAYLSGIAQTDWTWAMKLADFDNDGSVDLFVTNGVSRNFTDADLPFTPEMYIGHTDWDLMRNTPPRKEENLAFRNVDGLRFENVSRAWGLDHLGMSYAAAYGDLDSDGDLDLVVCNLDETVSIYRNEAVAITPRPVPERGRARGFEMVSNHWLAVRLRGTASHTHGWGALVSVKTASGWRVRQMNPATGFLSCNDPALHFGLGSDDEIEVIEVQWPSGQVQRVENPAVDQVLTLTEPDPVSGKEGERGRGGEGEAVVRGSADPALLFASADDLGLDFRHQERPYDDYAREPLLPGKLSQLGPGIAVGDANGDGHDDVYFGGAAGQSGVLYVRGNDGRFARVDGPWQADGACEDMGAVWFDADNDGRLDLYVVSGGVEGFEGDAVFQDRLYLNRTPLGGPMSFVTAPEDSLPDTRHAGSAVCAADFDRDGDVDLFVGSRSIPGRYPQTPRSLLLRNDSTPGQLRLVDVTDEIAPGLATAGLVTGALWSDVDADGFSDLLVACEWGPVRLFHNQGGTTEGTSRRLASEPLASEPLSRSLTGTGRGVGKAGRLLVEQTEAAGLARRIGWWNGITAGDFDSDGRVDYLVTNVGLNTKYGEASRSNPSLLFAGEMDQSSGYQIVEAKIGREGILPVRSRSAVAGAMPLVARKFPSFRAYAAATLPEMFHVDTMRQSVRLAANEFRSGLLVNRSTPGKPAVEWQPLPDIAQIAPGYGIAVADYNGDGRPDAAIAQNLFTREPETGLWRGGLGQLLVGNEGVGSLQSSGSTNSAQQRDSRRIDSQAATPDPVLVPAPARYSGIVIPGDAKGAASLDLDGDARPDLVIAQNDDAVVPLRNRSDISWLALRLIAANGPPAIGARVTVHFADGRTTASEICAGNGYLSQSAPEISIGLGGQAFPVRADIRWPTGEVQRVDLTGKIGRVTLTTPADGKE